MKISLHLALVLALAATSSALSILVRPSAKWAVLNLPGVSYVQMEMEEYDVAHAPRIDSMKLIPSGAIDESGGLLRRIANLHVWSSTVSTGDTGTSVHLVQITQRIPNDLSREDSLKFLGERRVTALRIDTIVHHDPVLTFARTSVGIPHVDNSHTGPRIVETIQAVCLFEEQEVRKARLLKEFTDLWEKKPTHVVLDPVTLMTFVYVSPWSRTLGTEDLAGIVAPLPGNRGNWIDVQTQAFSASQVLPVAPKPAAGQEEPTVISLVKPHTLPTGFARYIYNRTNHPETKILEPDGPRRIDGVYKVGPTLDVSGSTRDLTNGGVPSVDTLMGKFSWLVLADSSDTRSLERAMWPKSTLCGGRERNSAWKIKDSIVWLDQTTSIALSQLLSPLTASSTSPGQRSGANALSHLAPHPEGLEVRLSQPATVRIASLSGRLLRDGLRLPAGNHVVGLGDARGMIVVNTTIAGHSETRTILR